MQLSSRNLLIVSVAGVLAALATAGPAVAPLLAAATSAEKAAETVRKAPAIRVAIAERREIVRTLDVTGTILPRQEAQVGTDLNGMIVLELRADSGDRVAKGDVLAVLDRSMLDTQLAQVDANRAQAEANVAQVGAQITDAEIAVRQAEEGLQRARELQKKGVAAQAQLDNAVNAFDSANARLVSARKALVAAEAQLGVIDAQRRNVLVQIGKTEVRAPADGLVLARNATLGGVVSPSGGALFRIAIDGQMELVAEIAETLLPSLAEGMGVTVTLAGAEQAIAGRVRMIDPEVDQKLRMGRIRVALPEGSPARAGNFARGAIELARSTGVAVPSGAVLFRGRDAFLQKVVDGRVATVPVTLGLRDGALVEVVQGLAAGDEIVSRAGTFVADGDHVTPVREERMGALLR